MHPRIYLLALGTFTVGTEGYVIAGVLPSVAHDMHTSVSMCGQLVTVFALVYALAGAPLIGLLHQVPPKRLLMGAALVFALANGLAAVAPDFAVLTGARVLAALGAALFAAPAAATAAALCAPEELPRAISVTAGGNALALTLGAPLGTVVGSAFGWRASFGFVTLLAIITAVAVWTGLPDVPSAGNTAAGRLNLLRRTPIRWGLVTTFGLFLAAYCVYTYLSPVAHKATGLGSDGVATLMIVFGAGGLLAGRLISRLIARRGIALVLRGAFLTITALLAVLTVITVAHVPLVATVIVFPLMFMFGSAWWSGGISQQARLAGLAPTQRAQVLGLHFSAQYLGVAVGGALGGLALSGVGPTAVPLVGGAIALACVLSIRQVTPAAVVGEPAARPRGDRGGLADERARPLDPRLPQGEGQGVGAPPADRLAGPSRGR
ncbi:MFS transporter [Kitasatospora kifunensis]|uniref:Putative MFS family arabinose efflux permease n=1 Tax=Kitasatospora kifunensis TaxID=58351 RepID=A0A7W7R9I3_KITKI|nr:MFS transporter [Kitasatospora kifunensis]MBB4927876.1 putative MFS family arabinose efflux permease [Kitasatospora kifunensis]